MGLGLGDWGDWGGASQYEDYCNSIVGVKGCSAGAYLGPGLLSLSLSFSFSGWLMDGRA